MRFFGGLSFVTCRRSDWTGAHKYLDVIISLFRETSPAFMYIGSLSWANQRHDRPSCTLPPTWGAIPILREFILSSLHRIILKVQQHSIFIVVMYIVMYIHLLD